MAQIPQGGGNRLPALNPQSYDINALPTQPNSGPAPAVLTTRDGSMSFTITGRQDTPAFLWPQLGELGVTTTGQQVTTYGRSTGDIVIPATDDVVLDPGTEDIFIPGRPRTVTPVPDTVVTRDLPNTSELSDLTVEQTTGGFTPGDFIDSENQGEQVKSVTLIPGTSDYKVTIENIQNNDTNDFTLSQADLRALMFHDNPNGLTRTLYSEDGGGLVTFTSFKPSTTSDPVITMQVLRPSENVVQEITSSTQTITSGPVGVEQAGDDEDNVIGGRFHRTVDLNALAADPTRIVDIPLDPTEVGPAARGEIPGVNVGFLAARSPEDQAAFRENPYKFIYEQGGTLAVVPLGGGEPVVLDNEQLQSMDLAEITKSFQLQDGYLELEAQHIATSGTETTTTPNDPIIDEGTPDQLIEGRPPVIQPGTDEQIIPGDNQELTVVITDFQKVTTTTTALPREVQPVELAQGDPLAAEVVGIPVPRQATVINSNSYEQNDTPTGVEPQVTAVGTNPVGQAASAQQPFGGGPFVSNSTNVANAPQPGDGPAPLLTTGGGAPQTVIADSRSRMLGETSYAIENFTVLDDGKATTGDMVFHGTEDQWLDTEGPILMRDLGEQPLAMIAAMQARGLDVEWLTNTDGHLLSVIPTAPGQPTRFAPVDMPHEHTVIYTESALEIPGIPGGLVVYTYDDQDGNGFTDVLILKPEIANSEDPAIQAQINEFKAAGLGTDPRRAQGFNPEWLVPLHELDPETAQLYAEIIVAQGATQRQLDVNTATDPATGSHGGLGVLRVGPFGTQSNSDDDPVWTGPGRFAGAPPAVTVEQLLGN